MGKPMKSGTSRIIVLLRRRRIDVTIIHGLSDFQEVTHHLDHSKKSTRFLFAQTVEVFVEGDVIVISFLETIKAIQEIAVRVLKPAVGHIRHLGSPFILGSF